MAAANPLIIRKLNEIFGETHVFHDKETVWGKSCDLWPANLFRMAGDPGVAMAVVEPNGQDYIKQLTRLVIFSRSNEPKLKLIARGGGTGVCGAANARGGEIIIDMSKLTGIYVSKWPTDLENGLMYAEPGVTGRHIDCAIKSNNARFSCKHYPASYYDSSVAGWIQTNASGHWGRIRDLAGCVFGINGKGENVILFGKELEKVLGLEGTTILITGITLPIFKIPPKDGFYTFRFPDLRHTAEFLSWIAKCRKKIESESNAEILTVRFYDWIDYSFIAKPHKGGSDASGSANKFKHFMEKQLCRSGKLVYGLISILERLKRAPWTGVIHAVAEDTKGLEMLDKILKSASQKFAGEFLGPEVAKTWYDNRFKLGYDKILDRFESGIIADTFDCTPAWDNLARTYRDIRSAFARFGLMGAHLVLAKEGPYYYFTYALAARKKENYEPAHEAILKACINSGASTTHHHGIGVKAGAGNLLSRFAYGDDWLRKAVETKKEMDPDNILNPGKIFPYDGPPASWHNTCFRL